MGSSCSISLARQVGKSDHSCHRRWVGRGEEAEKGNSKIFVLKFFVPNLSLSWTDTIIICVGRIGGLMTPEIPHLYQRKPPCRAQKRDPAFTLLSAHPVHRPWVSRAGGSDAGWWRSCLGSPSLCTSASWWELIWDPLTTCFSIVFKFVFFPLRKTRDWLQAHHSTTTHTFYAYITLHQCSSHQSLS